MTHKKKAFTLIELLVVIVIIGILASLSTATFKDYANQARFAKAQAFDYQLKTSLAENLKAEWTFDGTTNDTTGNEFHGTPTGTNSYVKGVDLQAIDLSDGTSVQFGSQDIFNGTEFTLSLWINQQESNGSSANSNIIWGHSSYLNDGFRAGLRDKSAHLWTSQSGGTVSVWANKIVELNTWHHIVFTYDGTTLTLFFDGEIQDQQIGNINPSVASSTLNGGIGGTQNSKSYFDEVRWFDKAFDINNF